MEKSWENMELAGMSDRPHGSLSARTDTKDGSKKYNKTFQHFYTTSASTSAAHLPKQGSKQRMET